MSKHSSGYPMCKKASVYKFLPILGLNVCIFLLISCAVTPRTPLPENLLQMNPEEDCLEFSSPGGWKLKAEIFDQNETAYLVVFFDPGFIPEREPEISLPVGSAIFEGNDGYRYYYRLGKLSHSRKIGNLSFKTKVRGTVGSSEMMDKMEVFRLERKEDSSCLLITFVKSMFVTDDNRMGTSHRFRDATSP
jgi:hypothetical protein